MTVRFYSSVALQTTLTSGITASATTIQVASTTGFPGSTPFVLAIDYGAANEELVDVTSVAALSLTVTRSVDGTSAGTHNAGAVVRHVSSGRDFADSRAHENASTGIHGLTAGSALVGTIDTQTLSNKTLTMATGTLKNVDIFNKGVWETTVIGDSTAPTNNRLAIIENEITLQEMAIFGDHGGLFSYPLAGAADTEFRWRAFAPDRTTERSAIYQAGAMSVTPNSTTTLPSFWVQDNGASTTKAAHLIGNVGGSVGYFTTFRDGHTFITPPDSSAAVNPLLIKAPATPTADMFRVVDTASTVQFAVQSTGLALANRGATVARTGQTSGTVLRVGSTNAGYTGNLTEWLNPAGTIVGAVNQNGDFTTVGVGGMVGAYKTADTSRANTVTRTADPHLSVAVQANAVYIVEAVYLYNALAAADIDIAFLVPAGASGSWTGHGAGISQSAQSTDGYTIRTESNTITQNRGFGGIEATGVPQDMSVLARGTLVTAGTAGNLQTSWSQRVTNATATIMLQNSHLKIVRIA